MQYRSAKSTGYYISPTKRPVPRVALERIGRCVDWIELRAYLAIDTIRNMTSLLVGYTKHHIANKAFERVILYKLFVYFGVVS